MKRSNNYVSDKVLEFQSKGIYSFSLNKMREAFPDSSDQAIGLSLNRLVRKGKVVSVHKGFYVIVTPEYTQQGIVPAPLFVDGLMKHLKRKYYVGILNAAALHGAAHQQPQEYFVITELPALRAKKVKGLKIQYVPKTSFPSKGIEQRKTDTGYFQISSPELTAFDLVQFEDRVGGLNRVAKVMEELIEVFDINRLQELLKSKDLPYAYAQRLGYILDKVGENPYSDVLESYISESGKRIQNVPLKPKGKRSGFPIYQRWKIIENVKIDLS